ncbi:MAG: vWA domain-containing protein [Pirellulaceae bacterium]
MRPDLTDITLIVDRSGSMQSICADAEGGINAFVAEQAQQPGEALLTLVQFDTEYEFLHRGVPIQQVPPYRLVPRGSTALLDAVGRAINETGERLSKMLEQDRPGLVIFVVMTDGEENSSQEFSKEPIKQMITHQQDKYGWHFTFLGANQDAFAEAGALGIQANCAANFSPENVAAAYQVTGQKVARMRAQRNSGETVRNEYTDQEREDMA